MATGNNPEKQNGQGGFPFKRIIGVITHNWGLKLGCFLLAVFLWGGLIMQDTSLLRSKTFNDVTISVLNSDILLRNGYIVVSGLEQEVLSGVRMRVEVPQRIYETAQPTYYNVRVDLSRIRGAGVQTIPVLTTSSTTYGNVADISVSSIEVTVEEYAIRSRIPVRIATTGSLPEGIYGAAATADPIYVEIAGPKSQIDAVARCVARYDLSELPSYVGTERTAVPLVLEDRQENEIPLDRITVSPLNSGVQIDSITVEQSLYELVSLPVSMDNLITGTAADGYRIESITVEPAVVRLAFSENVDITGMSSLHVSTPADITGLDSTHTYSLQLVRPSDAKYLSVSAVQLTVEVVPDRADHRHAADPARPDSDAPQAEAPAEEPADAQ